MYTETADQYELRGFPPETGGWPIPTQHKQELGSEAFALLSDIHWWKFTNTAEVQASACNTDTTENPNAPNLQHTAKQEQNDQCGNSTA